MRRAVAGLVFVLFALPVTAWAGTSPAERGAKYITSQQASDGSFTTPQNTGETLAAMVAGGIAGTPVDKALSYLKTHGKAGATEGAYTGRIIAGIVAAGQNPRSFGGVDYVSILHSQYNATTGDYDNKDFFADLMAANGANAAKDALPAQAIAFIDAGQCPDGGFASQGCSGGSDVDTTAWAVNVLIASGHKSDAAVGRARNYLIQAQRNDGGFGFSSSQPALNADSTGLAIAAIDALGEDATKAPWVKGDKNPVKALVSLQTSNGSFRATPQAQGGNLMSTVNAVPGLAHDSYPVLPASAKPKATPTPQPTHGTTSGGGGTTTTSAPSHASAAVDAAAAAPVSARRASTSPGAATSTTKQNATARSDTTSKAKPTPYVLGFGGIATKPGGLSMAAWAAVAAGCTGLGVGIWFLRARLR